MVNFWLMKFFSTNVKKGIQEAIRGVFDVHKEVEDSNYLSLPSLIGRSKR